MASLKLPSATNCLKYFGTDLTETRESHLGRYGYEIYEPHEDVLQPTEKFNEKTTVSQKSNQSFAKQLFSKIGRFLSPIELFESIVDEAVNEYKNQGNCNLSDINITLQEQESENALNVKNYWIPKDIMHVEDAPYSRRIIVVLLLLSFSCFGNMARISFQELLTYQNAYIYYRPGTIVWINFTSCIIMGFANNSEQLWDCLSQGSSRQINLKQIPLHTAITAGFCGCFSTFSGFITELVFESLNLSEPMPNNGYGVMQFFAVLFAQVGLCLFGLQLGCDIAYGFDYWVVPRLRPYINIKTCRFLEYLFVFLGISITIVNIVLSIVLSYDNWYKNKYSIALLFGLFGCHARFKLMELNGRLFARWFPTGTFLSNVIGSILLAIFNLLLHGYKDKETKTFIITSNIQNCIIRAFANGFCGSLSTFAAMCNELVNLGTPEYRYTYFTITFLSCFLPAFLILAPYFWMDGIATV
jgi:fluoride ion exporter CrcB/FEX